MKGRMTYEILEEIESLELTTVSNIIASTIPVVTISKILMTRLATVEPLLHQDGSEFLLISQISGRAPYIVIVYFIIVIHLIGLYHHNINQVTFV